MKDLCEEVHRIIEGKPIDYIEVELPRPRERSSYDFLQIRRNVMKALFEKDGAVREVEYYI